MDNIATIEHNDIIPKLRIWINGNIICDEDENNVFIEINVYINRIIKHAITVIHPVTIAANVAIKAIFNSL